MKFEFSTAGRIVFGQGSVNEILSMGDIIKESTLVVTGKDTSRAAFLLEMLGKNRIRAEIFNVPGEPTTDLIIRGIEKAREAQCRSVIGIGGGSVIDAGKVIAAFLTNRGELFDYLEVIGKSQPLNQPPAPYIAIPTTAGTGTEVTRNSVIRSPEYRVKVSIRSRFLLPLIAIVDPALTFSMPPDLTAGTGLDALTQLIEAYVCNKANPFTDGICIEGLKSAAASLRRVYENGNDAAARENMCVASLFSGIALANAGLGAVHGLAAVIGGMFDAPHGFICAKLLPLVMEVNINALKYRAPQSPALQRYVEIAKIITQNHNTTAYDSIKWIDSLCAKLTIPCLTKYGIGETDFPIITEKSLNASSMKGNPIVLTKEEMTLILYKALKKG